MNEQEKHLEALKDIRKMMQESSKFLTLSGFSGVLAGVYALIGAWLGYRLVYFSSLSENELIYYIALICSAVLVLSLASALLLSAQKAKRKGQKLFDKSSYQLILSMAIPLVCGGIFCMILLYHRGDFLYLIAPAMLLFYGFSLINSSKYTYSEVKFLGLAQMLTGLIATFYYGHGILFWAIGFGGLHIVYGFLHWMKYEKNQ